MALTNTTNSAAVGINDTQIVLTSATAVAPGVLLLVGHSEFMLVAKNYVSGTTVPVIRAQNGTANVAHVTTETVNIGTGEDFGLPPIQLGNALTVAGKARPVQYYAANGAISLPAFASDAVAVLIGTSTLTMTLALPTLAQTGSILYVVGNAKSQSTVGTTTAGYGNAGSSYDLLTFQNAGNVTLSFMAVNGFWSILNTPITGTSTALSVAIA